MSKIAFLGAGNMAAAFAEGLSCAHRKPDQIVGLRGVISARQRGPFALGHDDALRRRRWRQLEQRPRQLARRRRRVKIGRVAEQRGRQPALGETGEERFVARRGLTGGNCLHASGLGDREAQPESEPRPSRSFYGGCRGGDHAGPLPPSCRRGSHSRAGDRPPSSGARRCPRDCCKAYESRSHRPPGANSRSRARG